MLKKLFYSSTLLLFCSLSLPLSAHAQIPLSYVNNVFSNVVTLTITATGLGSLVMVVISGYQYLMSGGNKEALARASSTMTYAIGGLILTVSAWMIINLLGVFLGVDFSLFSICLPGQSC